jgi:ATP-dependent Clp protease ATP-binding subunit ClpC
MDMQLHHGSIVARMSRFYAFTRGLPLIMMIAFASGLAITSSVMTMNLEPVVATFLVMGFPFIVLRLFLHDEVEATVPIADDADPVAHLTLTLASRMNGDMTTIQFLSIATDDRRGKAFLSEVGLDGDSYRAAIETAMSSVTIEELMAQTLAFSTMVHEPRVAASAILAATLAHPNAEKILASLDLSVDDLQEIVRLESLHERMLTFRHLFAPSTLLSQLGTIGRTWVMGYTDVLTRFTRDISDASFMHGEHNVVLHRDAMEKFENIFDQSMRHNGLLIGTPGVGRRTMIRHLAARIRKREIEQGRALTRVLTLDTASLLAADNASHELFFHALDRAGSKEKFIFVIPEFASLIRSGGETLTSILVRYLTSGIVRTIGIISNDEFHGLVRDNPTLGPLFTQIELTEPTDKEAIGVLTETVLPLERKHGPALTYRALKEAVVLSKRFLSRTALPGSAIDVIEECLLHAKKNGLRLVTQDLVRSVVTRKSNVDVTTLNDVDRNRLLHLADAMQRDVIGQNHALSVLADAMQRARLNVTSSVRPLATFLFLGPTGVGKTETAKALARAYFGDEKAMVRLDMNEYALETSIPLIIGTDGAGDGFFLKQIQDRPFTVVLLDEIEKAHPKVLGLFLQVLDEGFMTDVNGRKTDCRSTIVIATSNAGALTIRESVQRQEDLRTDAFKKNLSDSLIADRVFAPEFLNRFDDMVVFTPLTVDDARSIALLMIDRIVSSMMQEKGIAVTVTPAVVDRIVAQGYSLDFGARSMRRAVTDVLENAIAEKNPQG